MPVGQAAKDYLAKAVNPTLLKGLTELCKQKPKDPVVGSPAVIMSLKVYVMLGCVWQRH